MKKLCSLALILALLVFCGVPSARALEEGEDTPARMSLAIVVSSEKDNAMAGFVVAIMSDYSYILTDSIMIQDGNPYVCVKILFEEQSDGSRGFIDKNLVPAEPVWIDSSSGIVLLAVKSTQDVLPALFSPPLASASSLSSGDLLYRIGLDITENNPDWSTFGLYSTSASGTAIVSSNYPSGLFSMTTAPVGGSVAMELGGPVINDRGIVVGISAIANVDGKATDEFIYSLDELLSYLDREGITYAPPGYYGYGVDGVPGFAEINSGQVADSPSSPSGGSGSPSSPSGGGGSGSPGSPSRSGSSGSSGGPLEDALSGGMIGIVSAAAAGGFLWLKKKKEAPQQQTEQSMIAPAGGPVLLGIGGQMDGCRFPLQGGNLSFGRDPGRCSVVYDSGAPGISSLHCQLILQGGSWCLIDLASSYGTYLNGRRLEPSVPNPLQPGDTFWLGQPQNSFTLKEG